MNRFITRTGHFMIGLPVLYLAVYISADVIYNSKKPDNSLFIWGDSQTMQGIDLEVLKRESNRDIYTAARHGAGVYHFLAFVEKVPANSDVLVAISKPVQLRRKEMDRNRCVISICALKLLIDNNYSFQEILKIIETNIWRPERLFLTETQMYDYADTIVVTKSIELFENIYKKKPSYLLDKQKLLIKGIEILNQKNCKIYLIQFPYHAFLKEIEQSSPIKENTDSFFNEIMRIANVTNIDTLHLNANKQVMHDLTHLNGYGAGQVSLFLANILVKYEGPTACIVQLADSAGLNDISPK